jgi:hypothetical protein
MTATQKSSWCPKYSPAKADEEMQRNQNPYVKIIFMFRYMSHLKGQGKISALRTRVFLVRGFDQQSRASAHTHLRRPCPTQHGSGTGR